VRQVRVEPLSPAQIESFLTLHLPQQGQDIWETLRQDAQQVALFAGPFFLRLLVEEVAVTGEIPAGQAALLTGFVRRALVREVVERRQRLFAPGRLLSDDDVQQVIQHAWAARYDLPPDGPLIPHLEKLAYGMQDGYTAGESGQVRIPEKSARALLAHEAAGDLIAAGIQLNVLDKELATRTVSFYHQLLQEYFAARGLARNPEPARVAVAWQADRVTPSLDETVAGLAVSDPLPALPATGWEETTLLAAAMAVDQERFVTALMDGNLPLSARCAAAVEVTVTPALKKTLQQALLARIGEPAADLRARIAAAAALGELGDSRFERRTGPHGAYLLPPLASIAGGRYTIGSDEGGHDDEKPAHEVTIAAFEMGVFPVTNAEYALFMAAGGYEDERWWETEDARAWLRGEASTEGAKEYYRDLVKRLQGMTEEAIQGLQNITPDQIDLLLWLKRATPDELESQLEKWYPSGKVYRQPKFWEDSRFNKPGQPVVGITWFEARAYCAWLSAQMGKLFSLPTEAEWEAAAGGREGRAYAYGAAYDAALCNTFETHIRGTTPVGVFPGGNTPEGIMDLSGNVWEWTSSAYRPYPYDAVDGREDTAVPDTRRVLRGGSWHSFQFDARSACRSSGFPEDRGSFSGFRVVVRR
ncbi:MAG: formylglycine-generating enzyme family protein, partial [Anaerolineae bacterium]